MGKRKGPAGHGMMERRGRRGGREVRRSSKPCQEGGHWAEETWRQVHEILWLLYSAHQAELGVQGSQPLSEGHCPSQASPNTASVTSWVSERLLQVLVCPKLTSHAAERHLNGYNKGRSTFPWPVTCKCKFKCKWALMNVHAPNQPQCKWHAIWLFMVLKGAEESV